MIDQYHHHYHIKWPSLKVYLKDYIKKKKINKYMIIDNKIFNYFGNDINASRLPVTLSLEIKIRSMSWYGSFSVLLSLLLLLCCLFIRDSANCKLVRGMAQTSIMSVCTEYKFCMYRL